MPRRSAAAALETRAAIVARAVEIAAVDGLEGVTIGRLAGDLEMSKSGVLNHFRTKEGIQLAVVEAYDEIFRREVWERARGERPGLRRLLAAEDAWLEHIASEAAPGGCFYTAASAEFDDRPGAVRERLRESLERWHAALRREASAAVDAGELPAQTDPDQVVFELRGAAMTANQQIRMLADPEGGARFGKAAVRRVLGLPA